MSFVNTLTKLFAPTPPIAGSGFRKRGRNYKKMMKNPPNRTGWFQRRADLSPMLITERMLMRHGWYRRKLRKEGVWMKTTGPNEVMLSGFAEKHFKTRAQIAEQYPNA